MTALLNCVVVAAGVVTQKECALPVVQSMSEVHPVGMQEPFEQMLEGGLQSVSLVQATVQVPMVHLPIALWSDTMQSGSVVQGCVLHRCVAASHDLPAAQSRSLPHLK